MKKLFTLVLLVCFSSTMLAGWSTNERRKCRWYAKKFAANARVYSGLYDYQHSGHCDYAYAEVIKKCAYQKVSRGWGGIWQNGAVYQNFCSRGEIINLLEDKLLPVNKNILLTSIEESTFTCNNAIFNDANHSIQITGMTGSIKLQKGNGFYSNIRLSIWKPNDDLINFKEDDKMDDNEILNQFEIKVTDNGIFFNGNLVTDALKNQFKITEKNNEIFVTFENVSIEIPINSNISIDDLAVMFNGDGAPNTTDNINNTIEYTENSINNKELNFVLYPNPTTDKLNIEFSNILSDAKISIEVYNADGEKLLDVFNGDLKKEEAKSIEINLSSFAKGRYFVLIDNNDKKLIKQVIKN